MKMLLISSAALLMAAEPVLKEGLWSIHTQNIDNTTGKKDAIDRSSAVVTLTTRARAPMQRTKNT